MRIRSLSLATRAALVPLALALAGCAGSRIGPDAPSLPVPVLPRLAAQAAPEPGSLAERPAAWWSQLQDPVLEGLVEAAFLDSPSLDAAAARVRQVRASQQQLEALAFPSVSLGAQAQRTSGGASQLALGVRGAALESAWELDLFGGASRGRDAARARTQASEASLAQVRVALAADVVDAYALHRQCELALRVALDDLASRQTTARLTRASVEAGFTAPYLGERIEASVADAQGQVLATRLQCERTRFLLGRLTGLADTELKTRLALGEARLPDPRTTSVYLPVQALSMRPDIRAAERQLVAASADIGVAMADRLPRVSLSGSFGYSETAAAGARLSFGTWSFGPALSVPLFDGGRRAAAVDSARARYDEAFAAWRGQVRLATQELEDALSRYAAADERLRIAQTSRRAHERSFEGAQARWKEGAASLLELEDARRVWLLARQTELAVRLERLQAWGALHRASAGAADYAPSAASAAPAPLESASDRALSPASTASVSSASGSPLSAASSGTLR